MTFLSPRRVAVTRAVLCTIVDHGAGSLTEERIAFTLRELRAYLDHVGLQTRIAFRAALLVVQLSPWLLLRGLRRFVHQAPTERARCLAGLERSRLGLVVVLLKTTLCLHWYEHPEVLARTGYDGEGLLGPAYAEGAAPPVARKLPILPESSHAAGQS
jgi:hypothetical protein